MKKGHQIKALTASVLAGALLIASSAQAQTGSAGASGEAGAKTASALLADFAIEPKLAFQRRSMSRSYIDRQLFPNTDTRESKDALLNAKLAAVANETTRPSEIGYATGFEMSETHRLHREALARDEAYRILSRMVFSIRPIKALRDMLEPYTKPLEVYANEDGTISKNYFGQAVERSAKQTRVFSLNVNISSSNNLNFIAYIYDRVQISLLDGARLIAQYTLSEGGGSVGFESNNRSDLLFRYSLSF